MSLKFVFPALLLLAGIQSFAQQTERHTTWQKFYEDDKVEFYSVYLECNRPQDGIYAEYVMLRAVNKTADEVQLSFYTDKWYDGKCISCNHTKGDTKRVVILSPRGTAEGDCAPGLNNGMEIFSRWLKMEGHEKLTEFQVSDISTKILPQQ